MRAAYKRTDGDGISHATDLLTASHVRSLCRTLSASDLRRRTAIRPRARLSTSTANGPSASLSAASRPRKISANCTWSASTSPHPGPSNAPQPRGDTGAQQNPTAITLTEQGARISATGSRSLARGRHAWCSCHYSDRAQRSEYGVPVDVRTAGPSRFFR